MTGLTGEQLRVHVLARLDALTAELAEQRAETAKGPYDDPDSVRIMALSLVLPTLAYLREVMNVLLPGLDDGLERLVGMAAAKHPDTEDLDREERAELVAAGGRLLGDILIVGQFHGPVGRDDWSLSEVCDVVLDALVAAREREEKEEELAGLG